MMRKTTYEIIPYFYMLFGIISMFFTPFASIGQFIALFLYLTGVYIWVKRSSFRRSDKRENGSWFLVKNKVKVRAPLFIYEFSPFFIFAIAIIIFSLKQNILTFLLACFLSYYCIWVIGQRVKYREHGWLCNKKRKY